MNDHSITIAIVACAGFLCVSSVVWMFTRDTTHTTVVEQTAPEDDGDEWKRRI